eukprot:SAG31_NODE_6354_length_2047_cov_2.109343_3_plen_47_part_01
MMQEARIRSVRSPRAADDEEARQLEEEMQQFEIDMAVATAEAERQLA